MSRMLVVRPASYTGQECNGVLDAKQARLILDGHDCVCPRIHNAQDIDAAPILSFACSPPCKCMSMVLWRHTHTGIPCFATPVMTDAPGSLTC